jgi:hypothetical protein
MAIPVFDGKEFPMFRTSEVSDHTSMLLTWDSNKGQHRYYVAGWATINDICALIEAVHGFTYSFKQLVESKRVWNVQTWDWNCTLVKA